MSASRQTSGLFAVVIFMAAGMAVSTGCRSTPHQEDAVIDRYVFKEAIPADSLTVTETRTFQIRFGRPANPKDLEIRFIPEAQFSSITTSPSGQFLYINDVQLSSRSRSHRLLIDGALVPDLILLHYFSGELAGDAQCVDDFCCILSGDDMGFMGAVGGEVICKDENVSAEDAIVFAFLQEDISNTNNPLGLFDAPAISAALPVDIGGDRFRYVLSGLQWLEVYTALAVVDTDKDGIHDPYSDWWGYYGAGGVTGNVEFAVCQSGICQFNDMDIELRPPGTYNP